MSFDLNGHVTVKSVVTTSSYFFHFSDMIAIPNFAFAGMENWGLIMYRETALLYQPGASSESHKQLVSTILSHELAHQVNRNNWTLRKLLKYINYK